MATSSPSITYDNSSDALFRAWATAFDAGLVAVGLSQHAQTGQIDFATVTKPTAGSQARGYMVYKYNDGLAECYFRVGYGSGGNGALNPGLWLMWGRTLDGATNFTGADTTAHYNVQINSSNAAAGTLTTRFCKVGGAVVVSPNEELVGTGPYNAIIAYDRTRDAGTGTANATGVSINVCGNNTALTRGGTGASHWIEFVPTGGVAGYALSNGRLMSPLPDTTGTWGNGTDVGVAPCHAWYTRAWQMLSICACSPTDFTTGTTFAASYFGTSHTYRNTGTFAETSSGSGRGRIAMLWE